MQIVTTFVRLCLDFFISQFGCLVHEWATSIELSCRTTLVKYNDQVLTITETGELTKKAKGPIITINYKRVIEVWMDEEYKKFFYTRCLRIIMSCQNLIVLPKGAIGTLCWDGNYHGATGAEEKSGVQIV